ncbi:MAG: beta-1-3, beta-1-6-glucan biosynthesis protein [Xanthobacteraceae bacterium]
MRRLLPTSCSTATRRIAIAGLAIVLGIGGAAAQSGDPHPQEQKVAPGGTSEPAKEAPRKVDEFVEAAQAINGPAGNPECVWAGQRVVSLMWRDDLDTAFRHLDLYDRFGCPGGHVQATFRCLTKFAEDLKQQEKGDATKQQETLARTVHICWINPNAQPQPAASPPAAAASAPAAAPAASAK